MKSGAVELAYTVAEGDVDTDGVSNPRDALRFNGGRIAGTNGNTDDLFD